MPIYRYVASQANGKQSKGIVDASSITVARNTLRKKGLYIRSITEDKEKRERQIFPVLTRLLYRVPRRAVALFSRRLGTLLEAGLPLDRSLANVLQQTENEYLKKALIEIRSNVMEGALLSDSMQKHPAIFPPLYYHLISIGEKTGTYEKALIRLADLEDSNESLRGKIINAAIYPVVMIFLLVGILAFLLTVVFPQIKQLFVELNAELPFITRFVIGVSDILTSSWIFLILLVFGIIGYYFHRWKSKPPGRIIWEKWVLKLPILGNLQRKILISRFSRNLGTMLISRVPLIVALQVIAKLVNHHIFAEEILTAIERIKEGERMSEAFEKSVIINVMVLGMLSAGENSDSVPEMIDKVADVMEGDLENNIERASTLLEPMMIVIMGFMIILIMSAILLPMYDLTNQLQL